MKSAIRCNSPISQELGRELFESACTEAKEISTYSRTRSIEIRRVAQKTDAGVILYQFHAEIGNNSFGEAEDEVRHLDFDIEKKLIEARSKRIH